MRGERVDRAAATAAVSLSHQRLHGEHLNGV